MNRTTSALRVAVLVLSMAAQAYGEDPAGAGLDLLALVDRSGSMSSHSPAAIVDALPLALNVIARSARVAGMHHRFGIVSFGSRAQTDVPLTLVDDTTLPLLRERIGVLDSGSLGNTNFVPPLEAASRAFGELPRDARRRRAILLVTDGHISVPGVSADASAAELQRLVESTLPHADVTMDVLLFGRDGVPMFWQHLSRDRVHRVQGDRGDVLATLHRVVTSLMGTRGTQQDLTGASRTLILPPYLELVVFDIVRGAPAGEIPILPPGATASLDARSADVEEVHDSEFLSTIMVRRPAAGAWRIGPAGSAARVKVLSQQFFPRGVLIDPAVAPPVRQHDFVTIGYSLRDSDGRALRELSGYPLSVDVSLALPDGRRAVLPMRRDGGSLYRTTKATECRVTGRYWTEVLVTTNDSMGQPVRIFEDRWSGFGVEEAGRRVIHSAAMPLRAAHDRKPAVITSLPRNRVMWIALAAASLGFVLLVMRRR